MPMLPARYARPCNAYAPGPMRMYACYARACVMCAPAPARSRIRAWDPGWGNETGTFQARVGVCIMY